MMTLLRQATLDSFGRKFRRYPPVAPYSFIAGINSERL